MAESLIYYGNGYYKNINVPLFKIVEIDGKKYCDHRVFGLHDKQWFIDHGVSIKDEQIPIQIIYDEKKGEMIYPSKKFMEGEAIDRKKNRNIYYKRDIEALEELSKNVKEIFDE